jgi:hypothetical protein
MRTFYARFLWIAFTTLSTCLAQAQVSVSASSGTTGPTTYTTLKAAFDAINAGTHKGSITVTITANTTESASAILNNSGTGGSSYTDVTIKPASGVTATISGNVTNSVVEILGSNVTIDGSNNGSSSRNLAISNLDTSKLAALSVFSQGTKAVSGVTVKNTVLKNAFFGLLVADSTNGLSNGNFTNITIQNNAVQLTVFGITAIGNAVNGNGNGVNISGNDLSATGSNANFNTGIYVQGIDGGTISSNTIGNFNALEDEDDTGIWIADSTQNTSIDKNKITNLGYTNGNGYGAQGIVVGTGRASANITVSNNMISNIYGDGWDISQSLFDNPIAIGLYSSQTGINIYYNSIYLFGSTINQSNAASIGLFIATGTTANVVDNIIENNLGQSGVAGYGAIAVLASGVSQFGTLDYNDYFVNPSLGTKIIGQIGSIQ